MGRSFIIILACIVSLPRHSRRRMSTRLPSGRIRFWKIAGRKALVAEHALKIIGGAEAELFDEVTVEHFLETKREWKPIVV
jgi:hypothetical protein